ncbi:MAG TPA: FdhF/YdeP family oxidoreductase [Candidatus Limnocylindria bacterium]|nr:FdhF/YdeP family oxidoreductase [Candidatus Limnocylindria bacterium]
MSPLGLRPDLWAGPVPFGIGATKPHHYLEMLRTVWDNRRDLPYAWRVLSRGVCDGCALGVSGFRDQTIDGIHLCTTRLSLLRLNTMGALDHGLLADAGALRAKSAADLRDLGRLAHPMIRARGQPGFRRASWDEALDVVAGAIRGADPRRVGFYLTARGITNETYYVAQKLARFIGTNNVDNAARICHAPSTAALKRALGVSATTCSYKDVLSADLVVLLGSDVANAQPVFMKYLYLARRRGTKVAVVNPLREPGLDRYWVPSSPESALFGTKMTDEFFAIHTGGDTAFLAGVLKVLTDGGGVDDIFIRRHTTGWDELRDVLASLSLDELARWSGASPEDIRRFATMYARSHSAVFVWSMGTTQHVCGSDNVTAIIDLALARGNVGRVGAGLMPIRGHSGVQGGAEMGAYATVFPGGAPISAETARALSERYGFDVPHERGLSVAEMIEAALRGEIDVLYSSGGNFLDTLPDPGSVRRALERVPMRVFQDIVLTPQMLLEPGDAVVLLPAATRYEQKGGGTETTTERRILFSPEIPRRVGEARSEWEIAVDLAARIAPERAHLLRFASAEEIRREIAEVVPFYAGIETLSKAGDQLQWGGARLCEGWTFPTDDRRAHFSPVVPREVTVGEGHFLLSTRRGKQFNTMVFKATDPLTGARRDAVFMSREDAELIGVTEGRRVAVHSQTGTVLATVRIAPIRPRNVQMFFPEANPLIAPGVRDPIALVPDYNAVVTITPINEAPSVARRERPH